MTRSRRPGRWTTGVTLVLSVTLGACVTPLPFRPERQPAGITISADVRVTGDRLRVEIDSEGYRVERAMLVRDGDAEVTAEALVPPTAGFAGGVSVGLGGGAAGSGSGGSYSVGGGVGIPLDRPAPRATTMAVFRLDDAGPPPWWLRVKVVGIEPVDILLDPGHPAP